MKTIQQKIELLISHEFHRFPLAQTQDYYKLLFQAVFGAEHMIPAKYLCLQSIMHEMEGLASDTLSPLYYDISLHIPLARLNLAKCKALCISPTVIAAAFYKGTKLFHGEGAGEGEYKFPELVTRMIKHLVNPPFNVSISEAEFFYENMKSNNFPPVHHSEMYRRAYNPHYRIIPLEILKPWLSQHFKFRGKF